ASAPYVRPRKILATLGIVGAMGGMDDTALAQSNAVSLPGLVIETTKAKTRTKSAKRPVAQPQASVPVAAERPSPQASPTGAGAPILIEGRASLTVPTTAEIQAELGRVPGAIAVVSETAYKQSTPATTIKDMLDYVPGVF